MEELSTARKEGGGASCSKTYKFGMQYECPEREQDAVKAVIGDPKGCRGERTVIRNGKG